MSDCGLQSMFYIQILSIPLFLVGLCLTSDYKGVGLSRFLCTTFFPALKHPFEERDRLVHLVACYRDPNFSIWTMWYKQSLSLYKLSVVLDYYIAPRTWKVFSYHRQWNHRGTGGTRPHKFCFGCVWGGGSVPPHIFHELLKSSFTYLILRNKYTC